MGPVIRMVRMGHDAHVTGVSHAVVRHSPDGFEWGYGGSGPSDLALNILLMVTDEFMANRLYWAFRDEVIAKVPRDGGELDIEFVKEWVSKKQRALAEEAARSQP